MNPLLYIGLFMIIWGGLYLVFAFVAKESGISASLFKVPAIFIFLPEHLILTVGRAIMGILFIGMGMTFIIRGTLFF